MNVNKHKKFQIFALLSAATLLVAIIGCFVINKMDPAGSFQEKGLASWYGKPFHGKITASGTKFDMNALTAAHKTLPFNTSVKVKSLANNKVVTVKINDRGPFVDDRIIDLSYGAAKKLDMLNKGLMKVEITAQIVATP